jgi:hypothetical protein
MTPLIQLLIRKMKKRVMIKNLPDRMCHIAASQLLGATEKLDF